MKVPVLRQLLDALGSSPLHLITAPAGAETPVSGVLIYEARATVPPIRQALLFAVGVARQIGSARRIDCHGNGAIEARPSEERTITEHRVDDDHRAAHSANPQRARR